MPKRFRLTRRFPVAMTEDGYRRLKRFAAEAGLDEGEALSFLFEHFDSVMDKDNLTHRLRLFNSELEGRKRYLTERGFPLGGHRLPSLYRKNETKASRLTIGFPLGSNTLRGSGGAKPPGLRLRL